MKKLLCAVPVAALMVAPLFTACDRNDNTPNYESRVQDRLKDANLKDVNANWNKDEKALHLTGKVDAATEKQRAEEVASQVVGTSGRVVNEVEVKGVDTRDEDRQIEDRLDTMFKDKEKNTDNLDLKFHSEAGVVTIKGEAPSEAAKDRVTQQVRGVEGVKDVVNDLDVKTPKTHTRVLKKSRQSWRNGFVRFSRPMVVWSPWPDQTTVSSGKRNRTSRIERSSVCVFPPGRSVRPIDPAKSVSPTNRIGWLSPSRFTARHTPPGQCPGVWYTRTSYFPNRNGPSPS